MKTILIVDDQQEVRELVEVTLRGNEFQILQSSSGEDAIAVSREKKPDLIIMDIMMPGGIDGLEATRILKGDRETQDIPVIILTAKGQEVDRKEGMAAGTLDYFPKPFSPLDLMKKIDSVLN
jgi:CheY-like chemotaxis protein